MKNTVFIFSILFLALSLAPCSDGHTCDEYQDVEITKTHDHSEDAKDHCSPFCTCTCCGMSINLFELNALIIQDDLIAHQSSPLYQSEYRFEFSSGIFRPPSFC